MSLGSGGEIGPTRGDSSVHLIGFLDKDVLFKGFLDSFEPTLFNLDCCRLIYNSFIRAIVNME